LELPAIGAFEKLANNCIF